MKTHIGRLGTALLAVLLMTNAMIAQTGSIQGVVRDGASGTPYVGVTVSLDGTTNQAMTGPGGVYQLLNVRAGVYDLSVILSGATLLGAEDVYVDSGAVTPQDIPVWLYVVTNTNNAGSGSLRDAITLANATPATDVANIHFNIPGAGVHTVQPTSMLPALTAHVVIDGSTQPGFAGPPLIELDGTAADFTTGLSLGAGCRVRSLIINRCGNSGLWLGGNARVEGCYIGTDATGLSARGNTPYGILVNGGGCVIGGTTAAARNVISGNVTAGIFGNLVNGTIIQGNYIGTGRNGTQPVPNGSGIAFGYHSLNTMIGGEEASARNVISGNTGAGVGIDLSTDTWILGNYIGVDASGSTALANGGNGITVQYYSERIHIGAGSPGATNVIAGNTGHGIFVQASDSIYVQGNLVGVNAAGSAMGNGIAGITMINSTGSDGCRRSLIGGQLPSERNVISANQWAGITIDGASDSITVMGNFIGTNITGTASLGNGNAGIIVGAPHATIGGRGAGARNIVSGNAMYGIEVRGDSSFGTTILGNFIGTDVNGTAAIGNGQAGVSLMWSARDVAIGGSLPGEGNVISGNPAGILISGLACTRNVVMGNLIGTDLHGSAPLPNILDGISIATGTGYGPTTTIGGLAPEMGNTIAYNGGTGVAVMRGLGNAILSNRIFANGKLGIDLGGDIEFGGAGVTLNDPLDPDSGANKFQNFPVIEYAEQNSGYIRGSIASTPNSILGLQFFASPAPDPSGYGEGQVYLGSSWVLTDALGNAAFSLTLPVTFNAGQALTATATDSMWNTSEFSLAYVVPVRDSLQPPVGYTLEQYATGLLEPEGMARNRYGSLFVAVRGSRQVIRIDTSGTTPYTTIIASNFKAPVDVAIAGDSLLLVADRDAGCLYAIDLMSAHFPVDANLLPPYLLLPGNPVSMEIGSDNRLYITVRGGDSTAYVARVDLSTTPAPEGIVYFTPGNVYDPRGIARAANGDMYFTLGSRGEIRLMAAGTTTPASGALLPLALGGLHQPSGIDLGIDGKIYVATSDRVLSGRPNSQTFATFLTGLSGGSSNDVLCTDDGFIYVSDVAGGRIVRVIAPRQQRIAGSSFAYVISQDGDPLITDGSDITAVRNGFRHWQDVTTTSLRFTGGTLTAQKTAVAGDGVNLVTFQDEEFPFPPFVLAVTAKTLRLAPNGDDATIVDADVLFNPAYSRASVYSFGTDTKNGLYDIESIVTHEAGHMVGLVHSGVPTATMFFVLQPGTGARTLAHDDQAWISHLYPGPSYTSTYGSIGGMVGDGYNPGTGVAGALVLASSTTTTDSVHAYTDRQGSFLLPGLAPGSYRVYIHPLNGNVFGYPLTADYISAYLQTITSITDFPAEYYNGARESANPIVDTATSVTPVAVSAGVQAGPITVITNRDGTAPAVVSVFPAAGSTTADVTAEVLIGFSESIKQSTVGNATITLKVQGTGTPVPGSFLLLNNDSLVVFTPSAPLAYATAYSVQVTQGVTDRHGNALASPAASTFTTRAPDSMAPTVEQIVPANGTDSVFITTPVTVVFSESVQPQSVETGTPHGFVMTGPGGPVQGTFTYEQGTKVFTFKPGASLAEGTPYTVTLNGIRDLAGNVLAAPVTSIFTTVPQAAPAILATGPYPGENGVTVATPILVDFSEPVNPVTITSASFQLSGPSGQIGGSFDSLQNNSRIVFRPYADLAYSSTYTITVTTAVQDISTPARHLAAVWTSTFTTASQPLEPQIFNIYPPAAAVGAAVTINGQGFDPDPLKNVVAFDTAKAVISSAGLNSLVVTVPPGPASGVVTVTVRGKTSAPYPFVALTVENTPANQVVATVKASTGTRSGDVTPDGALAYVTNETANSVSVIDMTTYTVAGAPIPVGSAPMKIAINPSGTFAYVTNYKSNTVSVIDLRPGSQTHNQVIKTIPVGINPIGVFVTPDGTRVYVAELTSKGISIIDGDSTSGAFNYVVARVNTTSGNRDAEVKPDGTLAFIAGTAGVTILDVNTASATYNQVVAKVNPSTGTREVTITPDGTLALVSTMDGVIWIIDADRNGPAFGNVLAKVSTASGARDLSVTPDGTLLYVTNYDNNTLSVYRFIPAVGPGEPGISPVVATTVGLQFVVAIPVGTNPEGLVFDPRAKVLLVANAGSDNVTLINLQNPTADYVILATNSVKLEKLVNVRSGNIVVNDNGPGTELVPGFELSVGSFSSTPAGYSLKANRMQVLERATVAGAVQYNQLVNRGTITGAKKTPLPLPVYAALPAFASGSPGTSDVTVGMRQSRILGPGKYRDISVAGGGTLVLTGGTYNVRNITVGSPGNLVFRALCAVRVQGRIATGKLSYIGPALDLPRTSTVGASSAAFYVAGTNGKAGKPVDQPSAVDIGSLSSIRANFYAPNGTIRFGPISIAAGSFLARDVLVGEAVMVSFDSYFMKSASSLPKLEDEESEGSQLPLEFDLAQNYPNPFNPSTTIQLDIPQSMTTGVRVTLVVFNILGQVVKELLNEEMGPGRYSILWDGTNNDGRPVASGMYLCRFVAGEFARTNKMMLLR
jgi:YVTN family beta-propeller protein